jgi:beta-galactosidase/beta-glucuronidase
MSRVLPPHSRQDHPRPQLERDEWYPLDGPWEFAIDREGRWEAPSQVEWSGTISVPFAPETEASGIGDSGYFHACWYRRHLDPIVLPNGCRCLLHFEAADWKTSVFVGGTRASEHEGGYTPFTVDLTPFVAGQEGLEVVVRVEDDPLDLCKPRGKQDWKLTPHSIWYPRTTGIWQTVWLEVVPPAWIESVRWGGNLERWEIELDADISGEADGLALAVTLRAGDQLLAQDRYTVMSGAVHRRLALSDPGVDDSRNELLWNPHSPRLIEASLQLVRPSGDVIDRVTSYTALRSISVEGERILLNGRPYRLRLVLDQGYWPRTGATAPSDAALRRDVELVRAMGFNGVRKHQKVESARYLYWADVLGLLVWEEMPSAYRFTSRSVERLVKEWIAVIARDASHPCIIAWVPLNESWGVPNLPSSQPERHYVQALYHLTRTLDASRLVVGNDGWESIATDVIGVHDYDDLPERIARRYHAGEPRSGLVRRERPGGRSLVLGRDAGQPMVLSEFGGIACGSTDGTWGYCRVADPAGFAVRYRDLMEAVGSSARLAGFCYTQFADTYQEANGLLRADRTPKFPLEDIRAATLGR